MQSGVEFKRYTGGQAGPESKTIEITFNITDEATDTEIDPIKPVSMVNYQAGNIGYRVGSGGSDGTTNAVTGTEPAGASDTASFYYSQFAENSDQVSPENSRIPVTVSVVEGPTTAREGTDFVIPPNQTLDLSSTQANNRIEVQYKGDDYKEDAKRVIVIVTIPDEIPIHFLSNAASPTPRKSIRIRFDIADNSDDATKAAEPADSRMLTFATSNDNGFLGGDIQYSVTINPAPTSPVSIPMFVKDTVGTADLSLPGTFESRVPQGPISTEPRDVNFITVGTSGTATGVIRVANSGTATGRSPVVLKLHGSINGYQFTPNNRTISIPLAATPVATEISISGPTSAVNEGRNAVFTLTADNATRSSDMTISVNVQDIANRTGADYVTEGTYYAVLDANDQTTTLNIPTRDDEVEGVDGVVMATVTSAGGYTVNSTSNEAFAIVRDTDGITPSTVTVSATQTSIEEGNMATFTISRGTADTGSMEVGYILKDSGDVIDV